MFAALVFAVFALVAADELNFVDDNGVVHSYTDSDVCRGGYTEIAVLTDANLNHKGPETQCVLIYEIDKRVLSTDFRRASIEHFYGAFYDNVLTNMRRDFDVPVSLVFENATASFTLRGYEADQRSDTYTISVTVLLFAAVAATPIVMSCTRRAHAESTLPKKQKTG